MVSFSNSKSPDQERREAISARDRYYYEVKALEKKIAKLEKELAILKNANQEVAYWKDVAETLQEYIDLMEE
jgi:hypothetical protein|tara:strand:- start:255 stop:470 length:216 start_codon:yes stop_codon:yes gene_type:complete